MIWFMQCGKTKYRKHHYKALAGCRTLAEEEVLFASVEWEEWAAEMKSKHYAPYLGYIAQQCSNSNQMNNKLAMEITCLMQKYQDGHHRQCQTLLQQLHATLGLVQR